MQNFSSPGSFFFDTRLKMRCFQKLSQNRLRFALILLLTLGFSGCGGDPAASEKEAAMAVRELIDQRVAETGKVPKSAASELGILLEALEGYSNSYGGHFTEFYEKAKSIHSQLSANSSASSVKQALSDLKSEAGKLNP